MVLYTSVAIYAPALALSNGQLSKIFETLHNIKPICIYIFSSDWIKRISSGFLNIYSMYILYISGRHESCDNNRYVPGRGANRIDNSNLNTW